MLGSDLNRQSRVYFHSHLEASRSRVYPSRDGRCLAHLPIPWLQKYHRHRRS